MTSARISLLFSLLAACASEPPVTSERSLPIINGTYDSGDPAVVALTDTTGEPFCTGTLVSRRVVVAAGHCVAFGPPDLVFIGSDPGNGGQFVNVSSTAAHPNFDFQSLEADISVVILADAVSVAPIPMLRRPPVVGESARFIGFGYTEIGPSGQYGLKYHMSTSILGVEATAFSYGVATCNGDSGGPALVSDGGVEVLAGVTSWGDPACAEYGYDTRVDVYAGWVDGYIADVDPPSCEADGQCADGCESPDPDCPCIADGFCEPPCPDAALDPDCPSECGAEGTCVEECPSRDVDCPIAGIGEACTDDFDCGDNLCVDDVCAVPCDPAAAEGECAGGETCEEVGGGLGACLGDGDGDGCLSVAGGRQGRSSGGVGLVALLALSAVVIALRRRKDAR